MLCCNCLRPAKRSPKDVRGTVAEQQIELDDQDQVDVVTSNRLAAIVFSSPANIGREQGLHAVQWRRGIRRHFGKLNTKKAQLLLELCDNDDLPSTIAYLDSEYSRQGLVSGVKTLEPTLASIESFSQALTCIAQAGPESVQLLWGSILFLVKVTMRHREVLDKITQMLDQLTRAMPRFETCLDLHPTIQLRRAMHSIYDDFIDFCLSSAEFLTHSMIGNVIRLSFSSVDKDFDKISQSLQEHTDDFRAEAELANMRANKKWQDDILVKLSQSSSSDYDTDHSAVGHLVSTLPFPRNLMFTGRDDILKDINESLQLPQANESDSLRSVTLYGMGGVGKTQIALEYAYRFKGSYTHLIWIKSETEVELRQSLTAVVKALGLRQGGESEQKDVDLAKKWLETTSSRWLAVFDNVQHVSTLHPYWPRCSKGNVIITSQRPSFDEFSIKQVRIRSLSVEEGKNLVLRQMHLDASDPTCVAKAEELSEELGGSPLAISHYTGYCVASHISLDEVLRTFQSRRATAEIWSNNSNISRMQYERTLSTVWDTALDSLGKNAMASRDLLDVLAFLNPDSIPEDLLRGALDELSPDETSGFDAFKLMVLISPLIRRNLVERNLTSDGPSIRIHRSLRLALMIHMDTDLDRRNIMFSRALRLTRQAFPRRDMTSRTPQNDPVWKRFMPQVLALQASFEKSDPPIADNMEFAGLLSDAASFLWEQQLNRIALPVLLLGEKIARNLVKDDEPDPILASIENWLSFFDAHQDADNRAAVMSRMNRVVSRRENLLKTLPPDTATIEQQVDVGRAWNDLGYFYADMEQFEEADRLMSKSLSLYRTLGDETTLRFRFSLQYADLLVVRLGQGEIDEALKLGSKSFDLCKAELGHRHLETVRFEMQWAYALIAADQLQEALAKLTDVLTIRSKLLEENNPDVLTTEYWIGTVYYYLDRPEDAEEYLRKAVEYGSESGFGKPDLARARYRLALVLHDQHRRKEAVGLEEDAIASLSEQDRPPAEDRNRIIRLLDQRIYQSINMNITHPHAADLLVVEPELDVDVDVDVSVDVSVRVPVKPVEPVAKSTSAVVVKSSLDVVKSSIKVCDSAADAPQSPLAAPPPKQPPPARLHAAFHAQYQLSSTPTQSLDAWKPTADGQEGA
ncbi:hypothetical protein FGRMN_7791 [Fusarium graminum]|nr:hypothetical protein FGRMN_7791 [Fusarium graminum]